METQFMQSENNLNYTIELNSSYFHKDYKSLCNIQLHIICDTTEAF